MIRATSLSSIKNHLYGTPSEDSITTYPDTNTDVTTLPDPDERLAIDRRANATFVILCRNSDLDGTIRSIRENEDRFNRKYQYPYVLLNEVLFTEEFKRRIRVLTNAKVEFGLIPPEHWYQPDWIDEAKATEGRENMVANNIIYGGSVSSTGGTGESSLMSTSTVTSTRIRSCLWKRIIKPIVHGNPAPLEIPCADHTLAFTITMYEYEATIPTLWKEVRDFQKLHPEYIAEDNALGFMSDNGERYNLCHFWSNFEIADMDFWRGEAYSAFFEYLDSKGGFYYERWGDAPVHSIGAALFLPRSKIHFWDEIGYEHNPYTHCPRMGNNWQHGRCSCDPQRSFDFDNYSCMNKWDRFMER
ncbi:hypothetical protein D9756_010537 [Leucocoprinus leucothites]|uniref:Glycosyltransferase family 15 protein n=1 Tax=Leucocoprinus leucothites TaxID=201217 RepID=A0A8H5CUV8_9AGAR|nr:hypothetical protein D9756_010537 [Leucoagaricus leucothites]